MRTSSRAQKPDEIQGHPRKRQQSLRDGRLGRATAPARANGARPAAPAQSFGTVLTVAHKRLRALGLWGHIREVGGAVTRGAGGAQFVIRDNKAFLDELLGTGRFGLDGRMGRVLHPKQISLREVCTSGGLHLLFKPGNRVEIHIDSVCPVVGTKPSGGSRFHAARVAAHIRHDVLPLLVPRRREGTRVHGYRLLAPASSASDTGRASPLPTTARVSLARKERRERRPTPLPSALPASRPSRCSTSPPAFRSACRSRLRWTGRLPAHGLRPECAFRAGSVRHLLASALQPTEQEACISARRLSPIVRPGLPTGVRLH